eukprot:maker-scaffold1334_size47063-snap-gene-0.11 protein:Tk08779 transcript:maker-scaffold1334_size47063-snap-gene-0.11-mRNA-1 annotation:"bccip homolog"
MASNKKRAHLTLDTPENSSESSGAGSSDEELSGDGHGDLNGVADTEIQVEFEARTPEACHFHGVLRLLQSLFKHPHDIPLAQLTEAILNQRQVGSVVTQSADSDEDEDEPETLNPQFSAVNDVFGLLTLFNLSDGSPLAQHLGQYLSSIVQSEADKAALQTLLRGSAGLILSERIVNLPSQISVPLFETLFGEIQKAKSRGLPFTFGHYILLAQVHKDESGTGEQFVKVEEEIIQEHAEKVMDTVPVTSLGGPKPTSIRGSEHFEPHWRILVLAENRHQAVMEAIKTAFPI